MRRDNGEPAARLADVIRSHRHRAGLTQQELASRAGLSVAALRDLEQGRRHRPRLGSQAALLQALGLDPREAEEPASGAAMPQQRAAPVSEPTAPDSVPSQGPGRAGLRQGLWLRALGPLEASLDGTPLPLGPPRRRAVLGLLAINPGGVVRRDSIMDALWGQSAPSTAPNLIQAHISRLRRLLTPGGKGREIIASAGGGYRLNLPVEQLDLLSFRALTADAETARTLDDRLRACALYEQALGLCRGEPLADLDVLHDQPGVAAQRRQQADAILRYAEVACGLGLHDRVLLRLHALAAAEPLDERVHAHLMIALAGVGRQAAALRVYEELRDRLNREFAIYPGKALTDAHLRVLRQDIPVVRRPYGQPPRPESSEGAD
ncbi:BTAD domain-containing putative transcriptional regulator [Streptomyces sp. CG1]|uniref:BTAD domain-containing putative transcriptional regulator n=1 Tax=Streptomyces sp. CG1 TaxID=1287523 RepID=UPI0034E20B7A